jgi:hypothetical protein
VRRLHVLYLLWMNTPAVFFTFFILYKSFSFSTFIVPFLHHEQREAMNRLNQAFDVKKAEDDLP